jgi:HSP20 family protein
MSVQPTVAEPQEMTRMTLMFRDPFADSLPLRQAMDRLFEESLPRPNRHWLAVDIYETAGALVIKAALPGVKPDEVDIAIDGDILTITGELKADEASVDQQYHRRELHVGSFERALRLPERFEAGKTDAVFENGILTLTIPKAAQAEVKHIKIQPVMIEATAVPVDR